MLFNSYPFIFGFLPIAFLLFYLLRRSSAAQLLWMIAASFFFYGYWKLAAIPILAGSVVFNYCAGRLVLGVRQRRWQKIITFSAIGIDLALLGYYKYAGFLAGNLCAILGHGPRHGCSYVAAALPIGISFFTFTQIAYLADAYLGKVRDTNFGRYLLFVVYFPHLIAGPILHHADMMQQFKAFGRRTVTAENLAVGLTVFTIGLFKKVCMADTLVNFVKPVFESPFSEYAPGDAWIAAISYSLQIYYDFSGYSDMALGMSFLFGIRLPVNFNSPYRAQDIIDFWRRWHMTLSAFLRDYFYIPLGGNRLGSTRRWINIGVTMLLGGLWHGANWTFIVWGGLHGFYLAINHAWRAQVATGNAPNLVAPFANILTLFCVIVAWVFFRAPSVTSAWKIIATMLGLSASHASLGIATFQSIATVLIFGAIALFAPNTQQLIGVEYFLGRVEPANTICWKPSRLFAIGAASIAVISIIFVSRQSAFLYFQF